MQGFEDGTRGKGLQRILPLPIKGMPDKGGSLSSGHPQKSFGSGHGNIQQPKLLSNLEITGLLPSLLDIGNRLTMYLGSDLSASHLSQSKAA